MRPPRDVSHLGASTIPNRRGVTLIELLVVLVLGGILLGSALSLLSTVASGVANGMERWDRLDATRTVWVTLERELRPGLEGRDWSVGADGALSLRAFRGFARICGPPSGPGRYPVAWRGERLPVPDRDSLLVLGRDGGWRSASLAAWSEGGVGCAPTGGEREGWMAWVGGGSESPVLVRLFERGSYSVHAGAFRYRRGASGRQPLTPEVFGDGSRIRRESEVVEADLVPRPPPGRRGGGRPPSTRIRIWVGGTDGAF
jgi:prepilin-type N-terminal cleavage/methylation domain-containing protein